MWWGGCCRYSCGGMAAPWESGMQNKRNQNRCNAQPLNPAVVSLDVCGGCEDGAHRRSLPHAHTQSSRGRAVNLAVQGQCTAQRRRTISQESSRLRRIFVLDTENLCSVSISEEMGPGEARFISHLPRLAVPKAPPASARPPAPPRRLFAALH